MIDQEVKNGDWKKEGAINSGIEVGRLGLGRRQCIFGCLLGLRYDDMNITMKRFSRSHVHL